MFAGVIFEEIDGYLSKIENEKVTRPPPAGLHVDPGDGDWALIVMAAHAGRS